MNFLDSWSAKPRDSSEIIPKKFIRRFGVVTLRKNYWNEQKDLTSHTDHSQKLVCEPGEAIRSTVVVDIPGNNRGRGLYHPGCPKKILIFGGDTSVASSPMFRPPYHLHSNCKPLHQDDRVPANISRPCLSHPPRVFLCGLIDDRTRIPLPPVTTICCYHDLPFSRTIFSLTRREYDSSLWVPSYLTRTRTTFQEFAARDKNKHT